MGIPCSAQSADLRSALGVKKRVDLLRCLGSGIFHLVDTPCSRPRWEHGRPSTVP